MKNKLPRKYRIISRVGRAECAHHYGVRNVGRLYQADNDNHRRVRRSDAPENFASPRYVGMHNGFADDSRRNVGRLYQADNDNRRRVHRSDAPENFAFPRYVDRHYDDAGVRNVGRLYQADNDNHRRVRRLDAPENIVSLRYVGMHNGDAGDIKTAETLVLSGFSGGGGAPI